MLRVAAILVHRPATACLPAAEQVTFDQADARLRRIYALAKETNDPTITNRVLDLRDRVKTAFDREDTAAAERLIRDAEQAVGLDPGGKTMHGLPVAQMTPVVPKE